MNDPTTVTAAMPQLPAAPDSHGSATKPRRKDALLDGANRGADQPRNALDVRVAVPLHLKAVLTYAEAAALGIAPERTLRRLVATGRVRKSVIHMGRSVRFVKDSLIAELLEGEG